MLKPKIIHSLLLLICTLLMLSQGAKVKVSSALPKGITKYGEDNHMVEINSIRFDNIDIKEGGHYQNTFEVDAMHEKLPDGSGVQFNVERVPNPLKEHLNKPVISRDDVLTSIKNHAALFYAPHQEWQIDPPENIKIEALSNVPNTTVFSGGTGFFTAALTAFAQHLPLAMSPDHVWILLTYAFAKHVDLHSEELRSNFVQHQGKKRLQVNADHMVMGGGDLDAGTAPEIWEDTLFPKFSEQIKEHIGEEIHGIIASDFTTTTSTARAASEITLMSAMKNYFSYGFSTLCGIPRITLLGELEDWVELRSRAEKLGELMVPEVAEKWIPYLLPVLDEFVNSYKGDVNHGFWQSMVKLRNDGMGSGSTDFISGWFQILTPYLNDGKFNNNLRQWNEMYFIGPDPHDFPSIISSVPVDWDYLGVTHNMHFHAGIGGYTQDPADGTLTPIIGWYVTHDPDQNPDVRLEKVKEEIEALLKGHEEEARLVVDDETVDEDAPWFVRVSKLHAEKISLGITARRIVLKRELEKYLKFDASGHPQLVDEEDEDIARAIVKQMEELELDIMEKSDVVPPSTVEMIKAFFSDKEETCSNETA